MNTDRELLCSEKQAITSTPLVSTDSVLLTGSTLGLTRGRHLRAFAQIETALAGGAGTGITAEIIGADDAALTSNVVSLYSSGNIVNASAPVGTRLIDQPMPATTKAYVGFRFTSAGGAYASGAITAGFLLGTETPQANRPAYQAHGF
ncbi:Bbp16 family capsid cement protein [Sphingomonas sp. URHD0057]|uniref:Bbp16 family capsid cement protein n=1 Tax=Sphingomonas sp. URHD0057 TaxID=1380389 RepID=UPI00048C1C35|nr:hypothetical protein [Sphingomonas sp. URHD0057]